VAETHEITARLGEPQTVMFKVTNAGPAPSTGIATFNVTPELIGGYFVKIACFCFTEQTLQPGETLESAVLFYVDPDMAKDANTKDIPAVTLSYTYFPSKNGAPVTTAASAAGKVN
jgi:cytochrome c oxidase assembly protein subunit 11